MAILDFLLVKSLAVFALLYKLSDSLGYLKEPEMLT